MNKIYDFIAKYQSYFLGLAIFLSLSAVSITIIDDKAKLVLQNYPGVMFILVVIGLLLVVIYIIIDKRRIKTLSAEINNTTQTPSNNLSDLTDRQRQVYDLIILGKSNKEIMSDLYIEQSTLKSHINQIYRKLNIKNRRELKSSSKA